MKHYLYELGYLIAFQPPHNEIIVQYPYISPHITKPKECKKIFIVTVPPNCTCEYILLNDLSWADEMY